MKLWLAILSALAVAACQQDHSHGELAAELATLRERVASQGEKLDELTEKLDALEAGEDGDDDDGNDGHDDDDGDDEAGERDPDEALDIAPLPDVPPLATLEVSVGTSRIAIAGEAVTEDALAARFRDHAAGNPGAAVVLRIAPGVAADTTMRITDLARGQGITQIAVVRQEDGKRKSRRKRRRRR